VLLERRVQCGRRLFWPSLQRLRLVKGVRRILRLRVLDSRNRPHSEEMIEGAIQALEREKLDWRRLDLSTRTVKDAAKSVHTLHLYASGSWTLCTTGLASPGWTCLRTR
jgi:hypothetical protein